MKHGTTSYLLLTRKWVEIIGGSTGGLKAGALLADKKAADEKPINPLSPSGLSPGIPGCTGIDSHVKEVSINVASLLIDFERCSS